MKRRKIIYIVITGLILLSILSSCSKPKQAIPNVTNPQKRLYVSLTFPYVTDSTAVIYSTVTSSGKPYVKNAGFYWSTTNSPYSNGTIIENVDTYTSVGYISFSDTLTKLIPNSVYYVQAFATNGWGTFQSPVQSFATRSTKH